MNEEALTTANSAMHDDCQKNLKFKAKVYNTWLAQHSSICLHKIERCKSFYIKYLTNHAF